MDNKRNSTSTVSVSDRQDGDQSEKQSKSGSFKDGLSFHMASFFLVAQMAGAGFLALPKAFSDSGWLGLPMLVLFCGSVTFAATRLGRSWVLLEQRWPQYKDKCRSPYMEIAFRALGIWGRRICLASVTVTLGGNTTVYIILIAQFLFALTDGALSTCAFVCIVGACIMPFTWLGSPKDFWQTQILAVVATLVACIVIFVQLLVDDANGVFDDHEPEYRNPTLSTFSLGFGAILFAFGGSSVFPTVQNDMADKSQFWKSAVLGFSVILCMYLPVSIAGYTLIGYGVDSNIMLAVTQNIAIKIAIGLQIINLIGTYIISFNPVAQAFEDVLNIPNSFNWKRVVMRSSIVVLEVVICLAIPDFSLIINLIGGSATTICTFVLPPLMYIKLCDMKGNWPKVSLPLWERVYLIEIIIVGILGGVCATVSAAYAIIQNAFDKSCFTSFNDCCA
ncbi:unnamed protein product [Meganyctiphanes norvegica]|uniref:Amino acid transporter transmembrane domain-containing protein n=1 Tax=Meganyctiphanes norvegica TaxID=48144 RepID=A0AAV2QFF7_MEGNR